MVAHCARLSNLKPEFENASLLVYFGKALFQVVHFGNVFMRCFIGRCRKRFIRKRACLLWFSDVKLVDLNEFYKCLLSEPC